MTQPNPFAAPAAVPAPVEPPVQPAAANPFGQPAAAPQAYVAPAPAAPAWLATPPPVEQAAYAPPFSSATVAPVQSAYQPPALNVGALNSVAPAASGGTGADLWAMFGWLVMVLPTQIESVPIPDKWKTDRDRANGRTHRERITANVIVIADPNGGTADMPWGGDPRTAPHMPGYKPHTETAPLPYVRKSMWLSGKLVGQLRPGLPAAPGGAPSPLIGRVMKDGVEQTDPWFLSPATPEDLARAKYYLEAVGRGQFPHPLAP